MNAPLATGKEALRKEDSIELQETLQEFKNILTDWKNDSSKTKKLTKKQLENVDGILNKIDANIPISKEDLANALRELKNGSGKSRKPKSKKTYRQSGHYVDQKLKYSAQNDKHPDFFEQISDETKDAIQKSGNSVRIQGIRLSPAQDKLMNAIFKLLHDKSEHKNQNSERYYAGNLGTEVVPYGGGGQVAIAPNLRIAPSELYKAYLDKDDYSGEEIRVVKKILKDTEEQKFLVIYRKHYHVQNAKGIAEERIDRIEGFQSLFQVVSFFEALTPNEDKSLDAGDSVSREKKEELVIRLNPLLRDQIDSKYVEYPEDIDKRMAIAAGGPKRVTESAIALRDWLMREVSLNHRKWEINEEKLPFLLKLDAYVKTGRKGRIQERILSAIQTAKNLGILLEYEIVLGAEGQNKYVFHINPDFT